MLKSSTEKLQGNYVQQKNREVYVWPNKWYIKYKIIEDQCKQESEDNGWMRWIKKQNLIFDINGEKDMNVKNIQKKNIKK